MKYYAEYSTATDMWINAGEHETAGKARHALRGYAKAGHRTRIIEVDDDAPLATVKQLLKSGQGRFVQ